MTAPDGGWGWVVAWAACLVYVILGGIERSYGVWYIEILDRYEASSAFTEWLIGVHVSLRLISFPCISMLYARHSLQRLGLIGGVIMSASVFASAFADTFVSLFICFGVIGGLGSSLLQFLGQVVIVEYFDKKKPVALGIAVAGSGIGGLIMSPLLSHCFEQLSYFETVLVISGICLQSLIAAALCYPAYEVDNQSDETLALLEHDALKKSFSKTGEKIPPPSLRIRKAQGRRLFEWDLLWNPIMLLYVVAAIASTLSGFPVAQLVVHFAVMRGQTLETASLLLVGTGLSETLFRTFGGLVFNLPALKRAVVPIWSSCLALMGLCTFLITLCYAYWEFQTAVALGTGFYCLLTGFSPLIIGRLFEQEAFGAAFALFNYGIGIGVLFGTFLAGYLKDASGSYEQSYYIMAGLGGVASLILWSAYVVVLRAQRSRSYRVYLSLKR